MKCFLEILVKEKWKRLVSILNSILLAEKSAFSFFFFYLEDIFAPHYDCEGEKSGTGGQLGWFGRTWQD